jgi:large subunit ribosomal protein L7A
MLYERLKNAKKTIGTKQTTKAVQKGIARVVYIARDAEKHITVPLLELCSENAVEVVMVESMVELGRACGIEVGAASAALVSDD